MALTDKDIVITPNRGSSNDPQIVFSGADASTSAQNITLKVYPTNGGTLSFEGSSGQLLSVVNTMSGTIFSANDISGIPSIEVLDTGVVKLAQYNGNVLIGTGQNNTGKLQITGSTWSNTTGGDLVIRNSNSVGSSLTLMPTNSSSYSAGWSVYAGASGSAIGDGYLGFYNHTAQAQRLKLDQSGNLTVSGYMYASRFVDADNNSYYLDPAGTSVLNNVALTGGFTQTGLGAERQYYLGNITANATQARRVEVARLFIDYNDWHSGGTTFVELQQSYFYGGDWQKWSISYDYNNVNCDLIEGNSPRGRLAQVTCSSPVQISGDYYYISVYVDVRYYGQYYVYLRTSWAASSSPTASGQSGYIYVYTDPATTPGYSNISDFTPNYTVYTNNNLSTGGDITTYGTIYKGGNTSYKIDFTGTSQLTTLNTAGKITSTWDASTQGYTAIQIQAAPTNNGAYIGVKRSSAGTGEMGYAWAGADVNSGNPIWINYMATSDNNVLRWYNYANGTELTLSNTGSLIAYGNMQAPAFYHKDNTGYYLKPASSTDALLINGHMKQGTLVARPYVAWGSTGATGQVIIKLPGASGNYGMIHAVIDIYEYSGNAAATVIVGGHNWNGAWYNYNAQVIGYTDKQVRVGFHGGQYCISIGSNGSSWSYGQVVLRKIQTGAYYSGIMDLSGTYNIYIDSNGEAGYSWVSGNLVNLRTPSDFRAEGYIYGARFVDTASSSYYVDPASGSYLGGTIYKDGQTVPWVAMQDTAPTATQYGDLWWQTSTGRLKIRYYDGSSAQWVDTSPVPDLSTYYSKAGGPISGSVSINGGLDVNGYIYSGTRISTNRYTNGDNQFLFQSGGTNTSGTTRHLNLSDDTTDPAQSTGVTGITWGQRGDNNPYYMIYARYYNNGYYNGNHLTLAWHTGIDIGASNSYGGTRFFNNSPFTGTEIFSVGKGDNNIRTPYNMYADTFVDINSTGYYIDGPGISVLNQLTVNNVYRAFQNYGNSDNAPIKTWEGVLVAGSDYGGVNYGWTIIQTAVPYNSYMMGGFSIEWFENYGSTNAKTTITLGGYWNPPSNSGMIGWEYTSTNPNIRPYIVVGYDGSGNTCICLQHFNSSYVQIVARDLWLGYSGGSSGYGNGWYMYQAGSLGAISGQVAVQPRLAVAMDSISYMTATIGRADHAQGYFVGGYNNIGASESRYSPIYTIGTNYMPSATSLGNWYGIGYGVGSYYGTAGSMGSDWGLAVLAAGVPRIFLSGGNGTVAATSWVAGDVFYQYNNTSYYLNPDAGTSLNVYGRGYFGAAVRGGNYGAIWGSGFGSNALGYYTTNYTGGGCGHPPWGGSPNFGGFINYIGQGFGAVWSGNGAAYYGGEPGAVIYGGSGSYTSGGASGISSVGGDGGYYAQGGAGIYAIGGANGGWYASAYGITRAPAAYFDGNVHIMTPSGSTQSGLNIGYFNYTSNDNSSYVLKANGPGYFNGDVDASRFRDQSSTGYFLDPYNDYQTLNSYGIRIGTGYAARTYMQWQANGPLSGYTFSGGGQPGLWIEMDYYDYGGLCIDTDGTTVYGAGDAGWVFRVIDEDSYQGGIGVTGNNATTAAAYTCFQVNQSLGGGAYVRGNFVATGNVTAYGSVSDINRKENIRRLENVLPKLKNLSGYYFNYKNDPTPMIGVIAQEVEKEFPELVYQNDAGPENEPVTAVHYPNLAAVLLAAIKEQQEIIENQESRLANLEKILLDKGLV